MIAFFPKSFVSPAQDPPEHAASVQPARRQSLHDLRRIKDLQEQLSELRLANLDKEQRIAMLNRELQERDRVLATLRRRQLVSPAPSLEVLSRSRGRIAGAAKAPACLYREGYEASARPIIGGSGAGPILQSASRRPVPAFINYCSENRGVLKMQNPNMSAAEITRVLGENWRTLGPSRQQEYARP